MTPITSIAVCQQPIFCNIFSVNNPTSQLSFNLNSLGERSLVDETEFESVAADFNEIIEESAEAGERVGGAEESDVTELYKHLQIVLEGPLVLGSGALHLHLAHGPGPGPRPLLAPLALLGLTGARAQRSKQVETHLGQLQLLLDVGNEGLLGVMFKKL